MTTCPICGAKINSWSGYYVMGPENQGPRSRSETVCSRRCVVLQQLELALAYERTLGEVVASRKEAERRRWWQR